MNEKSHSALQIIDKWITEKDPGVLYEDPREVAVRVIELINLSLKIYAM